MYRPCLLRAVLSALVQICRDVLRAAHGQSLPLTGSLGRPRATYFPGNLGPGEQDRHEKTRPMATLPNPRGNGEPLRTVGRMDKEEASVGTGSRRWRRGSLGSCYCLH